MIATPAAASTFTLQCRELAGHRDEPVSPIELGVGSLDEINSIKAVPVCEEAFWEAPGTAPANYRLARAYMAKGPLQDVGKALRNFGGAANYGASEEAVDTLGPKAAHWYRAEGEKANMAGTYLEAAQSGDPLAQLSMAFLAGSSEERDLWLKKSTDQSYAAAQYVTGLIHKNKKQPAEAVKWYRLAAEQGLATAQVALSGMYRVGDGVDRDARVADALLTIAAGNGSREARRLFEEWQKPVGGQSDPGIYIAALIGLGIVLSLSGDGQAGDGARSGGWEPPSPSCAWGEWQMGNVCMPDPGFW